MLVRKKTFNKKQSRRIKTLRIQILGLLNYLNHFEPSSENYINIIENDFKKLKINF